MWNTFCGLRQLKPIIVIVYIIMFDKGACARTCARTYGRTDAFWANYPNLRCRSPTLVLYFLCTCTKRIKTILPFGPFGPKWQDTGKNSYFTRMYRSDQGSTGIPVKSRSRPKSAFFWNPGPGKNREIYRDFDRDYVLNFKIWLKILLNFEICIEDIWR